MSASGSAYPTGEAQDRRKLVAVLYADMVGYSRLIGLDDRGTLDRLRRLRQEVIDPAIKEHGGRLVNTGGDSLLIVFDSIDGAVRCAVKVQEQVPIHDGHQPPDQAIRFRLGINIGDAIADGTDLHGDAVNVAARLQAECPPGGICVTRPVRDHVQGRLNLAFQEGALSLKNITRPIEAFVAQLETTAGLKSVKPPSVSDTDRVSSLASRPSIAILPFSNLSGDPEQEYFSDGLADDLITLLSRSRSLLVIARNSSFTYRGRTGDVKQIARELGVRYLVDGSVRRVAKRVRVNAQLIDGETGNHIWAERFDRALEDVFAVQDEITLAVATAIGPAVADAEMLRAMRRPPTSIDAWDLYQQGMWHLAKQDVAENDVARRLFERAIERDAMFVAAYIGLSHSYLWAGGRYLTTPMDEAMPLASMHARKAVQLDPGDADAQAGLAWTILLQGDMDNALVVAQRALSINQNSAQAHMVLGSVLIFTGRMAEGRRAFCTFERLSPRDANIAVAHSQIVMTYYFERDYEQCVAVARRQLSAHPGHPRIYRYLAAALGQLGRIEEARAALDMTLILSPREFEVFVHNRVPWMRAGDYGHMLDGLRRAGWQG